MSQLISQDILQTISMVSFVLNKHSRCNLAILDVYKPKQFPSSVHTFNTNMVHCAQCTFKDSVSPLNRFVLNSTN